jgi:hypothetical protein
MPVWLKLPSYFSSGKITVGEGDFQKREIVEIQQVFVKWTDELENCSCITHQLLIILFLRSEMPSVQP